jgi:hypothetical protein
VLADRELEVFRLIGEGVKTAEIAERLHLSVKTSKRTMAGLAHIVHWSGIGKRKRKRAAGIECPAIKRGGGPGSAEPM